MEHVAWLWDLLNEFPENNFDDTGPRSVEDLKRDLESRRTSGEIIYQVLSDGKPVGAIGYYLLDERTAHFHGIGFSKEVHGSGIARAAVSEVLKRLNAEGIDTVYAAYFAKNVRVRQFLKSMGAVDFELIPNGSRQNGKPIDWWTVRIVTRDFSENHRSRTDSIGHLPSQDIPCHS